jgi:hypothetical protein
MLQCAGGGRRVDSKNKLIVIVDVEVTNEVNDRGQLSQMAKSTKQILGVDKIEAVADMGYYDADEVEDCEQEGITVYIYIYLSPIHQQIPRRDYSVKKILVMSYDSHRDVYLCPAGKNWDTGIRHNTKANKCDITRHQPVGVVRLR